MNSPVRNLGLIVILVMVVIVVATAFLEKAPSPRSSSPSSHQSK